MSHFSFRLSSRRFLQELFMDVNFEILAEDARSLLASHKHYSNIEIEENNQPIQEWKEKKKKRKILIFTGKKTRGKLHIY